MSTHDAQQPSGGGFIKPGIVISLCAWTAVLIINKILYAPWDNWNAARLAPTFALARGYNPYAAFDHGPILSTIYTPLSYLAYLPAVFFREPLPAVRFGSFLSVLFALTPALLIHFQASERRAFGKKINAAAAAFFGLLTIYSPPLRYSVYAIHVDAFALGAAAVACFSLLLFTESGDKKHFFAAALFTAVSLAAKQTMIMLPLALSFYLLLLKKKSSAAYFLLWAALLFAVIMLVSGLAFGFQTLWFHTIQIPGHHTLQINRLPSIVSYFLYWLLPFALILSACRRNLKDARWTPYFIIAVFNLPLFLLSRLKEGGDVNNDSLVIYFLAIAATLAVKPFITGNTDATRSLARKIIFGVFFVVVYVSSFFRGANILLVKNTPPIQVAYESTRIHGGRIYFPQFPLAALLVDGKLYHLSRAVYEWDLAGFPISRERILAGAPPQMELIAYHEQGVDPLMMERLGLKEISSEWPGWRFFLMKDAPTAPST
jgi:hypothetical protein